MGMRLFAFRTQSQRCSFKFSNTTFAGRKLVVAAHKGQYDDVLEQQLLVTLRALFEGLGIWNTALSHRYL